jgi:hypothetical protein
MRTNFHNKRAVNRIVPISASNAAFLSVMVGVCTLRVSAATSAPASERHYVHTLPRRSGRQGRRDDPCPWVPQDKHNQIMRVNLLPPRGPTCQFLPGMLFLQQRLTLCHPRRKDRRCSFQRLAALPTLVSGANVGDCRLILKFPLTLRFEETGWNLVLAIAHRREWEW